MKRVLLVYQPTDGGVARHVSDLASGLAEHGYEAVLCGPTAPAGFRGAQLHVPLDLRRAIAPRADLGALAELTRIVQRVRPDVVHAHSSKAGAIARLGRPFHPRVPVIYTPHGYAFAGHFARELERTAYRQIEHTLARLTTRVACVCEAEARLARTIGPAERIRVVYNGVDPAGDGPVNTRLAELSIRGPVICAMTMLRPGKGLETLIDAMPRVLVRHPRAQVAIVGDGPDLDALRSRARMRGVAGAINFLGSSTDPLSVMRGAEVFVHPSWAESFPYVILEVMSAGVPIVASDVGGIGEALVDGESGLLVAPGEQEALARALNTLLADPLRGKRIADAAKRRLELYFTRSAMIERLVQVYDEVLLPRPGLFV